MSEAHKQQPRHLYNNFQQKRVRKVAERLYQNRLLTNTPGDAESDWHKAEQISFSPLRSMLFWINQPFIKSEKHLIEPLARRTDNAAIFRVAERVSPAIEAIGVLAIPFVLFFASQAYEERLVEREIAYQEELREQESERLQQQALRDYFNQLSAIMLEMDGDFRDPENERIRTLTTATTLTALREPGLDGYRKGQIIRYLSNLSLVSSSTSGEQSDSSQLEVPISLEEASLSGANLHNINLSGANLRGANLENASLSEANLDSADLSGAQIGGANLIGVNLIGASLRDVSFTGVLLRGANLSNANLSGANLSTLPIGTIRSNENGVYYWSTLAVVSADINDDSAFDPTSDFSNSGLTYEEGRLRVRATLLDRVTLTGANLKNTLFYGVDLSETTVDEATLAESIICKTKLPAKVSLDRDRDCTKIENIIEELDPNGESIEWDVSISPK